MIKRAVRTQQVEKNQVINTGMKIKIDHIKS